MHDMPLCNCTHYLLAYNVMHMVFVSLACDLSASYNGIKRSFVLRTCFVDCDSIKIEMY